jgi:glucose/arabinose dehydrogenase
MRKWMVVFMLALLLLPTLPTEGQSGITHRIEKVSRLDYIVVAMAWAPDGRLFITEKDTGRVRVFNSDGSLQEEPVIRLNTDALGERGLLGIAIDPNFSENHYIWVYHVHPAREGNPVMQRIVRFREENGIGYDPQIMLEIPYLSIYAMHYGGNLHFGPDGMLYVTIGDNKDENNSQNVDTYPGKILRFKVEGDQLVIPEDNPWPGSAAYAIGLRNSFDFAFDPFSTAELVIFASENGPACDDEVNRIVAGGNYGWRLDYGNGSGCDDDTPNAHPEYIYPLVYYTPPIAPVGITVYSGDLIPQFTGNLFFCSWADGKMRRLVLDQARTKVIYQEVVDLRNSLCHTDLSTGPDGALYYISSQGLYRLIGMD